MRLANKKPWMIFFNGQLVKEFPHYEQAVIWCYENHYVYYCRGKRWLDERINVLQDLQR